MAKTRMLKHDLRTSEKVAGWPFEIRYFWTLLWGYVDDHGKGKDNPLLVKADTLPLDPDITAQTVDEWLWVLAGDGVIARYTVEDTDYLAVINWNEHQKPPHPTKDVLPGADDPRATLRELHASRMKDAGTPHETFTHGLGLGLVKSGSGFVNEWSPAATASLFEDAYSHWPKKAKKEEAAERFKKAIKPHGGDPQALAADIIRFGDEYAATTEKQFTPALGVWLNQKRWTDDLPTAPDSSRRSTRTDKNLDFVAQLAREEQQTQRGITA